MKPVFFVVIGLILMFSSLEMRLPWLLISFLLGLVSFVCGTYRYHAKQ